MRQILSLALGALLLLIVAPTWSQTGTGSSLRRPAGLTLVGEMTSKTACLPDSEVSSALRKLTSGPSYSDQQEALALLRTNAERSGECRGQVVAALMSALDKPNLDLFTDRPSFYLWHYGSELLAELKAVESLDLLIAHLDLNDGTPFPLNHYPALGAVIKIGEPALPKLDAVLKQSPDRYTRRYAVFCIASIGGTSAKNVLKQSLVAERDRCVTEFIRMSLDAFDNKTLPDHVSSENRAKWYTTFLCHGE